MTLLPDVTTEEEGPFVFILSGVGEECSLLSCASLCAAAVPGADEGYLLTVSANRLVVTPQDT